MRLGIKGKQIAGVTAIVGLTVVALSALNVARLGRIVLHESEARGQLLTNAILHRAREVVRAGADPYEALRNDPGLRAILESSIYGENVTDAVIVDTDGRIIASNDRTQEGKDQPDRANLSRLLAPEQNALDQLRVIYSRDGQTLEFRQPMILGDQAFGSIRIGVSTLLMRSELNASMRPALVTAAVALIVGVFVAGLLAQLLLRPIHVIRSGLTRLGKGEFGVTLDLPQDDEFGDLNTYFNSISQQLMDRDVDPKAKLEALQKYSRKLVALGRLTAGIAHEVKNPLNAMMIHLELLRTKIQKGMTAPAPQPVAAGGLGLAEAPPAARGGGALEHVEIIESEVGGSTKCCRGS
jgi:signal transduction histidine kinase